MNLDLMDKELRRDEGVRYVPYRDTKGIPTVGVGHNLLASPLPPGWKYPLTDDQVNSLLNHDLQVAFAALDLHIPWWRKLDEVRQRVIANMDFNMGIATLMEFKNTLSAVQRGAYDIAAAGMKASRWYSQVGQRAVRLRMAMETGVMPAA
ncbi:glycoside hydrolase family protein [Burkholderia multivorans]|uniref:glycoside hydrolase family protein n=1 Tax=Burkholderia multivorans TaxID=87883 RepID=UPI001C2414EC|nr:glycoside hydrolase family protein [Burkholderia multivorans]MBU9629921.1 glycoside hydrolase family protein [Burkholderia multivorans]